MIKADKEDINIKRKINKTILLEKFGGKCRICGYNKCIAALEFHHKNPEMKKFNISKIAGKNYYSYADMQELTQVILVCANCHREIENGMHKEELNNIPLITILDLMF